MSQTRRGIFPIVVTPFTPGYELDEAEIAKHPYGQDNFLHLPLFSQMGEDGWGLASRTPIREYMEVCNIRFYFELKI
jgi:hypothetical protein